MATTTLAELIEQADALSQEDQLRLAIHLLQRVLQYMQTTHGQVHEPDAELANADDALQDAARLRGMIGQH